MLMIWILCSHFNNELENKMMVYSCFSLIFAVSMFHLYVYVDIGLKGRAQLLRVIECGFHL